MKLKDSTFAIVAEKKGSISHNWFNENIKDNQEPLSWGLDGKWIYYYEKGDWDVVLTNSFKKDCPIYTEYVFESLLKAEQDSLKDELVLSIEANEKILKEAATLSKSQIAGVIDWMNTWEQLRDTAIPIRFSEDYRNKLKAEQENEPKNTIFGKENIAHKSVFHPNGFVKPFKGVAITKSEAEKILRDKFKLPDYVEFRIVE